MKTRNGFVSNSSSASFVVVWKDRKEDITDIKKAVASLFDLLTINCEIEKEDWNNPAFLDEDNNKFVNKELFNAAKKIVEYTTEKKGKFETRFFTTMYNDINDFGDEAKSLVMALTVKDKDWDLLYSNVDDDNGW